MTDTIYEQLLAERQRYPEAEISPAPPAPEATMSLASIEADLRNGVEDVVTHVTQWAESVKPHLGHLADIASSVEQSPLVQAALAAVLPGPVEAELVALITRLHEQFGATAPAPAPAAEENLHAGDQPTDTGAVQVG